MAWLGLLIVIITFALIIKKFETRIVLLLSGLVMALIAGSPASAIESFAKAMVNTTVVTVTCTVMGFVYVIKLTKCDEHLVQLVTAPLRRVQFILIPAAVVVTFIINVALTSAAGTAAAAGAIIIPMLIRIGIHPAAAGAAVFAGTWGNVLSPGSVHPAFIAKLVNSDPISVILSHAPAVGGALAIIAIAMFALTLLLKENSGYVAQEEEKAVPEGFKASPLKAMVPVLPLVLLVLGSKQVAVLPPVTVPMAMLIGSAIALLLTRSDIQQVSQKFFEGMGNGYATVIGLIAAAAAFTQGMQAIGLTESLIALMKQSTSVAQIGAAVGPLAVAFLSGSGDAATLAFNGAVTPAAGQFGFDVSSMGSLAFITGTLGRTMSPVAAACIIAAQIAGVSPVELAKRTAIPMMLATVFCTFALLS